MTISYLALANFSTIFPTYQNYSMPHAQTVHFHSFSRTDLESSLINRNWAESSRVDSRNPCNEQAGKMKGSRARATLLTLPKYCIFTNIWVKWFKLTSTAGSREIRRLQDKHITYYTIHEYPAGTMPRRCQLSCSHFGGNGNSGNNSLPVKVPRLRFYPSRTPIIP